MVRILQGVSPSIWDHNFSYGPKWTATKFGTEYVRKSRLSDDRGRAFRQPSRHERVMLLEGMPFFCLRHFIH